MRRWLAARLSHPEARWAAAVFVAVLVLLLATSSQGFVRDEGYYFKAARQYHGWFEALWKDLAAGEPGRAFAPQAIDKAFAYNSEHPGFAKLLMGWSWKVASVWLGASHATGFRLGAQLVVALGAAFTFLFGARLFSRRVGLLAVALFFACPHVFFHSHLAAFDGPITALTVVVTYAFWRSLEARAWILGAGVAFGVALATKHNAVFLLPTLALAFVLARLGSFSVSGAGLGLPPVPLAFVAMPALGLLLLYVFYPYGWHAPLERLGAYYGYHLRHEHYPVDYFGHLYRYPPFPVSFPFVMSAITIPVTVLVLGLSGMAALVLQGTRATDGQRRLGLALIILNIIVPPAIIAHPNVPIFGGTKHWMPMMPFFALAAAYATWRGLEQLAVLVRGRWVAPLGLSVVLALPVIETARSHPHGFTYFNELVMGHQGGAALGMPRGFWGGAGRALLDELNARAGRGDAVFSNRMNYDSFRAYQTDGLLRADLRWVKTPDEARWGLAYHQREHQDLEYRMWTLRGGDARPVASFAYDGVGIVSLYDLPGGR